jgi:probable HAF family extracellular repeat protein
MAYDITDLGTLGGAQSIAHAVNEHGQAAGESSTANGILQRAFFWSAKGGIRDLGTLGGSKSVARAINAWGEVVGQADLAGDVRYRGFHWSATSGMQELRPLAGDTHSWAAGVDDTGRVVGASGGRASPVRAVLWKDPEADPVPLGGLGSGEAEATAVNATGFVVGFGKPATGQGDHAFLRDPAGGFRDLGTLGGRGSKARAISAGGTVVGTADDAKGRQRPFRWVGGILFDLGLSPDSIEGDARGLNALGDVVGTERVPGPRPKRAILFRDGVTHDLDVFANLPRELGWILEVASDVNDAGQIVGQGWHYDKSHAFLLTPKS